MTFRRRRWRMAAALLTLALVAPAGTALAVGDLATLPRPNLELLDAAVAIQLETRRAEVDELFAEATASVGERAAAIGALGGLYYLYDYVDLAGWCFAEAARLAPGESRWPYLTGLSARLDGDLGAAESSFVRALELDPDDASAHVRLGDVRLALGRPDAAAESYRAALELDPDRPAAHYGLGRIDAARGEHEAAIGRFEKALALQPEATSIHHQIGMAHRALGDREAARRSLAANTGGRLRATDPVVDALSGEIRSTSRWFSAGTNAMKSGEYEEAIAFFVRAAGDRPDDHLVDYNLALAYLRTGRRPQAMTALESAVEKKPDFRNGHYNLGQLLVEEGRLEEAEQALGRAHEIDPEDQAAHLEWAGALARLGHAERAEAELKALVETAPQLAAARLGLAQLQLARGDDAAAAAGFRRVLDGDAEPGETAAAHLGLGRLADRRRDAAAAVEHYRRAVAVGESLESRLTLAAGLGRMGRFEEAADTFSRAIEDIAGADGEAPVEAHFGRAMALLLAGAEPRARDGLEESLEAHPENLSLRHLYSRLLATSTDGTVRDGARALSIAREVFAAQQTLMHAETVAMALAETGDFAAAVELQRQVVAQAGSGGSATFVAPARRRLAAYERGEPVRAPWKTG